MGANLRIILPSEASIKAAWWKLALRLPPEGRWESRYGARRCWGEAAVHGSIWRGRPGIRPGSELKVTRNLLGTASCDGRAHARQGWHSAAHGPAVRTVAKPGARPSSLTLIGRSSSLCPSIRYLRTSPTQALYLVARPTSASSGGRTGHRPTNRLIQAA
jgi:hypothetical protein